MPQLITLKTNCISVLLLLLLSLNNYSIAQTMSTIAGNGQAGYSDEPQAITSQLYSPTGVAVSGSIIYVADGRNNRIRKFMPGGSMTTIAGNDYTGSRGDDGPATDAQLNGPTSVATDRWGNLYIADKYNNRVRKITPQGIIYAFAGDGQQGYSGDGSKAITAQLNIPAGMVADTSGNVYIADAGNNCIRKVTPDGLISTIAGTGIAGYKGDSGSAIKAQLNTPVALALDSIGNLYIADSWNYRIRRVTPSGFITTIAGAGLAGYEGDGGEDTSALLNLPTGLAFGKGGDLYIADQANNRIRRITTKGIITTMAGNGNAGYSGDGGNALSGEMNAPYSIATDATGNIYVAEQMNNVLRKITPPPPPQPIVKKTDKKPAEAAKPLSPIVPYKPMPTSTPVNRGFQYSPGSVPARRKG